MASHEVAAAGDFPQTQGAPPPVSPTPPPPQELGTSTVLFLLGRMDTLAARMDAQHGEVLARFERMDAKWTDALAEQRREFAAAIEKLGGKIEATEKRLDGKIDAAVERLDSKIDALRNWLLIPLILALLALVARLLLPGG